jgi:DNA-binding MarR family transcriptional regulator
MSAVNGPQHALALLGDVLDAFRRDLAVELSTPGRGRADVRALRSSQLRLLSLTPADGMRATDLARRVGMTKQALGEFADALETRGMLETVRDPADRRVRILRPTPRGRRAVAQGEAAIAVVEERWRDRLGPARWDALRDLLRAASEPGDPEAVDA